MNAVRICPDQDRECGDFERSWCDTCPNRATLPAAPAPTAIDDECFNCADFGCDVCAPRRQGPAPAPTGKAALQALADQAQALDMGYGAPTRATPEQEAEIDAAVKAGRITFEPGWNTAPTDEQAVELPPLPNKLLNLIGEYGMARTDRVDFVPRWLDMIDGIKDYTRAALAARQAPDTQVSKMKWAAIEAHRVCYETMLRHPEIVELGDDGVLHRAIHAIVGVETPSCSEQAPVVVAKDDEDWMDTLRELLSDFRKATYEFAKGGRNTDYALMLERQRQIFTHVRAARQVGAPDAGREVRRITNVEVNGWIERNNLGGRLHLDDARTAIDDAASIHMTSLDSTAQEQAS